MINNKKDLDKIIKLTKEEEEYFEKTKEKAFFLISDELTKLLKVKEIRKQFVPSALELKKEDFLGMDVDPLAEKKYSIYPHLIHHYKSTVALITSDSCFAYCRYCFRRNFTIDKKNKNFSSITDEELQKIFRAKQRCKGSSSDGWRHYDTTR